MREKNQSEAARERIGEAARKLGGTAEEMELVRSALCENWNDEAGLHFLKKLREKSGRIAGLSRELIRLAEEMEENRDNS